MRLMTTSLLILLAGYSAVTFAEAEMKYEHYFVRLLGARADWPENMTEREEQIMGEHYLYLKKLTATQTALMAGPVLGDPFGLIVLRAESEDQAREIMEQEPSVLQGVHTYEMQPMVASLMADIVRPDRYPSELSDRILQKEAIVTATVADVWSALTTSAGVKAFLGVACNIDLRLGGPYEYYFDMSAPRGSRGSEDCRVLSFLPQQMLSFEWNAPPSFGDLRDQRTQVVIYLSSTADGHTKLQFNQLGWGVGDQWDELYDYFDRAWSAVLGALVEHFN